MILIKNLKIEDAEIIAQNIDNNDRFEYLDLKGFNTLELNEVYSESSNWNIGEPLVYDLDGGIVIIQFSLESLHWFNTNLDILSVHGVSKDLAQMFCSKTPQKLYCLDTF